MNPSLINATHDPALRSWVASANLPGADFPIQNLPFAVFSVRGCAAAARCGVGIGDQILDVAACAPLLSGLAAEAALACAAATLNALMALGNAAASALRAELSRLLSAGQTAQRELLAQALHPLAGVDLHLPVKVGGYTDFFASVHHATNAGRLFRPDAPLLPNYKYVPVAYSGRANSVRVGGAPLQRPWGQLKAADQAAPEFAPARRLDYEVELGIYIGAASQTGRPLAVADAWDHVFGVSLLNDWSARDIQAWEYQPLGPFLAKSFATSVAPWVITAEALAPFRQAMAARDAGDPAPLPHLFDAADQALGGLSVDIEAQLRSARMRAQDLPAQRLSRSNAATLYWSFAQMLAHHTSNGSALDTGDLLGSGTISGATADALGSLLELTRGGAEPLTLAATQEQRTFLHDGDEVSLRARSERAGFVGIGWGHCTGTLGAATATPLG
ncbi:fumarylacetoacetase [Acidovorax sp. CCYZU-2555]|uniref:fumarylacetoacetase n=1 Tax=Acidovorax sp. CCYZU-2555 TaxID=2835042 RepID=UPI001BCB6725|nr:fumarylacetoacetase [Acidovorax sp. CCYZU-2555]